MDRQDINELAERLYAEIGRRTNDPKYAQSLTSKDLLKAAADLKKIAEQADDDPLTRGSDIDFFSLVERLPHDEQIRLLEAEESKYHFLLAKVQRVLGEKLDPQENPVI